MFLIDDEKLNYHVIYGGFLFISHERSLNKDSYEPSEKSLTSLKANRFCPWNYVGLLEDLVVVVLGSSGWVNRMNSHLFLRLKIR